MRVRIILLSLLMLSFGSQAKANPIDSILSLEEVLYAVMENHPIAKAINIGPEIAHAKVRQARGAFDPKLSGYFKSKQFDGQEYYQFGAGKLVVPTWVGIDASVGYEYADGIYINPERNVPQAGLWSARVSLPLGAGLFMDERRTQLRQAQVLREQAEDRQMLELNNLLLETIQQYYNWAGAYHAENTYRSAYQVAHTRKQGVLESARTGEVAAIDTVEAGAQARLLGVQLRQAELKRIQQQIKLNTFLWTPEMAPLEIAEGVEPPPLDSLLTWEYDYDLQEVPEILADWQSDHPAVQLVQQEIDQLLIERSLNREQLKPDLNIELGLLSSSPSMEWQPEANHVIGISFSAPLFLRKERGKLNETNLKLKAQRWKLAASERKLDASLEGLINQALTYQEQVSEWDDIVSYYGQLVSAERILFERGESNLFLINSRESTYLKAALDYISVLVEFKQSAAQLFWAGAQLQNR